MPYQLLARHHWVYGAAISESDLDPSPYPTRAYRRFTATIRGYRNWSISEGPAGPKHTEYVVRRVEEIRNRIDSGDESVFAERHTRRKFRLESGNILPDFTPGQRVVLARVRHQSYRGKTGTIRRIFKTKNIVRVVLDEGKFPGEAYDASLFNLDSA